MRHILILLCSLFLAGAALAADPSPEQKSAMQEAVGGQLEAFKAGRDSDAWDYAAPSVKEIFGSVDNFMSMVKRGYFPVYKNKAWSFSDAFTDNLGRFAQRVIIEGVDGKRYEALYTLEQRPDGSWKITSCTLLEIAESSA